MSLSFDATLKDLGAINPADFLTLFDSAPGGPVKVLNVDLSTVTAGADLVIGLGDPLLEIVHLDFQSGANAGKGRDVLVYNALLHRHYEVPVHSVLVLLRPKAAHSAVDGHINYAARPGRGKMDFGYEVVRLWTLPAEDLLRGPVGGLPLAMLGKLPEGAEEADGLAAIADRLWQRVKAEAPPGQAARLQVSAFEMMCLRVKRSEARAILMGVPAVRESEGILIIKELGREEQLKEDILSLARKRLGPEDEHAHTLLQDIEDLERLRRIHGRLVDPVLPSWQDLLDTP